jgi:Fe-S oxidoreductase
MATYKAEFLAHYYQGRLRPRPAYAFGWIDRWASLAAAMPKAVNFVTRTPLLRDAVKAVAGMPPERQIPVFAGQTFTAWFRQRPPRNAGKPPIMLWPDTFNNHFHPETARAAVEVLEAAGFSIQIPKTRLCCGRPLYDFGMLDQAQAYLRKILTTLQAEIDDGMNVVVLEPACAAVFRDELVNLFPGDEVAKRLSKQTYFFSEFLDLHAADLALRPLQRNAIVHAHCNQKALIARDSGKTVLCRAGLQVEILDSGCCGMAGSFGFEKSKYRVSTAIGELVLLPAVRNAAPDSLVIADGFSCREQIAQCTNRRAQHLAEVVRLALHERPSPMHRTDCGQAGR